MGVTWGMTGIMIAERRGLFAADYFYHVKVVEGIVPAHCALCLHVYRPDEAVSQVCVE